MVRRTAKSAAYDTTALTPIEYCGLQQAYDHFNRELFGGALGNVFITYQRRSHSAGYFAPDRFSDRYTGAGRHELALNPDHFVDRSTERILSVLVHEMVHVWDEQNGTASKHGYHNKHWVAKMVEIGLQPSNTGAVGGKVTGQQMDHYVIPDGPFVRAYNRLIAAGWKLNLESAIRPGPEGGRKDKSKTPFTCPECGQNAWGKPNLGVFCKPCWVASDGQRLVEMRAAKDAVAVAELVAAE